MLANSHHTPSSSIKPERNEEEFSAARTGAEEEEKMEQKKKRRDSQFLIWVLLIFSIIDLIVCIDDKCTACNAVAEEIEIGLSNEKPRNHLDMRHRLDSKGQREGKVIDYRVSELRVVELLDGLCEKMQDYTLEKLDSGKQEWVKVDDWNSLNTDKREARAHAKEMSSYCGRLLEDTEDDLAELIKKGSVRTGDVSKVLCQDLSKHCRPTSAYSDMVDDISYGEL
ncbi:uncharacterized protein LOC131243348 [Magnolia sinica]|uniref:uncharacterized protein LOC131243348 n=1 Tax=Magnolia sinica TaxID=86752 RepID=UPI002657FB81|nr:uncharacterized protein LOC131243348 [Magnolia sinica]